MRGDLQRQAARFAGDRPYIGLFSQGGLVDTGQFLVVLSSAGPLVRTVPPGRNRWSAGRKASAEAVAAVRAAAERVVALGDYETVAFDGVVRELVVRLQTAKPEQRVYIAQLGGSGAAAQPYHALVDAFHALRADPAAAP